jgi:geranylgeranyl diphosphate synthase type II
MVTTSAVMASGTPLPGEEERRALLDDRLRRLLPTDPNLPATLRNALEEGLLAPGKRLRPQLTLLATTQCDGDWRAALDPACALEMVHAASLILDDLPAMDDASERRGRPALHRRFGEDGAILAAVALMNRAYTVVADSPDLAAETRLSLVRELSGTLGADGLVTGQWRDLHQLDGAGVAVVEAVYRQKTGLLFRLAVDWGARVASVGEARRAALSAFADAIGLGYQALDDASDHGEDGPDSSRLSGGPDTVRHHVDSALSNLERGFPGGEPHLATFVIGLFGEHLDGPR